MNEILGREAGSERWGVIGDVGEHYHDAWGAGGVTPDIQFHECAIANGLLAGLD
jgi:hypothetical protein